MNFTDARHSARLTLKEVSDYFEISMTTVKRYESSGIAPKAIIECLRMMAGYFPDFAIDRNGFNQWRINKGFLWSPSGERFTSGDILASRINQQLVDALYRSNMKLRQADLPELEQPYPSNVIPFPKIS